MILVAGTLIAKLISAAFKIPLQHYIGNTCMGIFNSAYQYYTIMFVIATAGVPVALSKLVSESNALGRGGEVKRIAKLAGITFFSFGALCSVLLFFGADLIADLSNNPMAIKAIRAISPAVFFVSIVAVVRGYFQGMSNMIPTALSQIIEASGKVVLGLVFAYFAGVKGFDDSMKAALDYIGRLPNKRKIAVLGDMLELGEFSKKLHEKVGEEVAKNHIDILICVGEESKNIAKGAHENGVKTENIFHFPNNQEAILFLKKELQQEDVVLIKASNGLHFSEICDAICEA